MKIEKLFRRLCHYLGKGKKDSKNDHDTFDQLLKRLEHRRDQLRHRLSKETRACKQKRLKIELKIVEVKLEKETKRLREISKT
jgi:hypothetical protein